MSSDSTDSDYHAPAPFLVRLFCRTGAFHRPEEFASNSLPPHVSLYTWSDCTLDDLAMEVAALTPSVLPHPSIGTRLVFQLLYPDLRSVGGGGSEQRRFAIKDLGSVVIGQGIPAADASEGEPRAGPGRRGRDSIKTLRDARFVVGDYLSCAVLPPLADGSVAPASSVRRREANFGPRDVRPPRITASSRENGFGRSGGRGGTRDATGGGLPTGEWKRGEAVPYPPLRPHAGQRW